MIGLAIALASAAQSLPSAKDVVDPPFQKFWAGAGGSFLAQGVGEAEARQAFSWTLLQLQLGRCSRWNDPADIKFWRGWIRDKRTADIPVLRYLVDQGDQKFAEGKREGPGSLSKDACDITIAALIVEMKR